MTDQAVRKVYGANPYATSQQPVHTDHRRGASRSNDGKQRPPSMDLSGATATTAPSARARIVIALRIHNLDLAIFADTTANEPASGLRFVLTEFIYELFMTEEMRFTESVMQMLVQKMFVNEIHGRSNLCIIQGNRGVCYTYAVFYDDSYVIFFVLDISVTVPSPPLLDRGVVQYQLKPYDVDTQALIIKITNLWPPPPLPSVGTVDRRCFYNHRSDADQFFNRVCRRSEFVANRCLPGMASNPQSIAICMRNMGQSSYYSIMGYSTRYRPYC